MFFSLDSVSDVAMLFIINQIMDVVFLGETFNDTVFMLIYSFDQITGYANIKCSVPFTRQNIDIVRSHKDIWIPAFAGMTEENRQLTSLYGRFASGSLAGRGDLLRDAHGAEFRAAH